MKNRNIQFKPTAGVLIPLLLACFALLPRAQATPETALPGANTADGLNALASVTTGTANTAVGWFSLRNNTDGSSNTAVGAATLLFNIGDQTAGDGIENTAVGAAALLFNTIGNQNTAVGTHALLDNTEGDQNTALGSRALRNNITGAFNTATGANALKENESGRYNEAFGAYALGSNTDGDSNNAIGDSALSHNLHGSQNTAVGDLALNSNDINGSGGANRNTAVGAWALVFNTTGGNNTGIGYSALSSNTTGGGNVALGVNAGNSLTTGTGNVCIGTNVSGFAGQNNITRIRNIGSTPIVGGTTVVVSTTGGIGDGILGYASSSRRYKQEIKPMQDASESLLALKPVTFRAKGATDDTTRVKHYGLIAEEVATVNPDLVVFNPEGQPETLRFDSINAMLLNEFLKEHRKNEKQEAMIAQLKSGMEALTAMVKEQAAQIQKVSAQLEVSRAAPQTVLNNQ